MMVVDRLQALGLALKGGDGPEARAAMRAFAIATLAPVVLLLLGVALGGVFAALALVGISLIVWVLDRFVAGAAPHVPQAAEFPAADGLSVGLALVHLFMLPFMAWAISGGAGLSVGAAIALFLGFALWIGQVSNSNAHELIHRKDRVLRMLGVAVYASIGYGHHASAHRLVHHRYVATGDDPNTARRGEHFYDFLLRALPAEFAAGYEMEALISRRVTARGGRAPLRMHPYVTYVSLTFLTALFVLLVAGFSGLLVWIGLAAYAQVQHFLSDYVQHYGLMRRHMADGRLEPAGPQHSWDAPHWASSAMMLNAPRHADHHAHPTRAYPALDLPEGGMRLPYSLPFMAVLALIPPLWFRVMHPRLPALTENPARL